MAFSAFGSLGGAGAAGFLGGMQTAAQRMEKQKQTRDSEAMQMYSKLLASGEWEPVGPKGSPDGGIVRIGNVGMLRQKKRGPDYLTLQRIATSKAQEASYIASAEKSRREPKKASSWTVISDGKTTKKILLKEGEELPPGFSPITGGEGSWSWFKTAQSKIVPVKRGTMPPEGAVLIGTGIPGGQSFKRKGDIDQASIVGTKLRNVRDSAKRLQKWMGVAPDETSKQYQDQYKDAYIEAAGLEAEQKALAKGAPAEIRDRLIEEAQAKARRELAEKYPEVEPEEDEGLIDWILNRIARSTEAKEKDAKKSAPPFKRPGSVSVRPKRQPLQEAIGRTRR